MMDAVLPTQTRRSPLANVLFGNADVLTFAVLDGASARDVVKKLYQHTPEHCCLYRGELPPDMAAVAPYLVRLEEGGEFTEWVLKEGWGAHFGIFVTTAADLRTLRNHFREFLKVELPDRRTVFFRFYDPRVLRNFLPVCNPTECSALFGPINSYVMEGETPETGVRFSFVGNALKSDALQLKATD